MISHISPYMYLSLYVFVGEGVESPMCPCTPLVMLVASERSCQTNVHTVISIKTKAQTNSLALFLIIDC